MSDIDVHGDATRTDGAPAPATESTPHLKTGVVPVAGAASDPSWSVPDICRAYGWPTNLAGGGVIAIVEQTAGWVRPDMDAYFASIGQPVPTITDVAIDAANVPNQYSPDDPKQDGDVEVALDIQVAAAAYYVATGKPAVIRVYWIDRYNLDGIASAIRAAATDGCDVCSISYGKSEALWQTWGQQTQKDYIAEMEAAALAATQAGMVVLASAGDNDSSDGDGDGDSTVRHVEAPASCPHVIGCGGTTKTRFAESVWNSEPGKSTGEGTGGGFSAIFPAQSFQAGAPQGGRMVPDVAANADPRTPYRIFVHGKATTMAGTSAVPPLYAGLLAAMGRKLGFITPKLWSNQLCFNDIDHGDNGAFRARSGPDACTGLGSPIGTKLAALLAAAPTSAVAVPSSQGAEPPTPPAAPGWSGTLAYTFANGVLVATHAAAAAGVGPSAALTAPPPASFTVHKGHRYAATVTLTGFEQFAGNDTVAARLTALGFQNVTVTGSGATRQVQGVWTGPDTTAQLDSHLSNVVDLG